jgi:tRNA-splicing ligase RtcB
MGNQFGTLGSGNHFVEISEDPQGGVWCVLHSGSRGIGNILATAHVGVAQQFARETGLALESPEDAYLLTDSLNGRAYLSDMLWAQQYAFYQRRAMMGALVEAIASEVPVGVVPDSEVNCHHNYAEEVEPGLWLTRKGAVDASWGRRAVLPGSMGTDTYIVEGLGNADSYHSAPHGAGRVLARGEARRTLDIDAFRLQMADRTWDDRAAENLLDEAPDSYKPIEVVLADSADLIEPVVRLRAFINYKGVDAHRRARKGEDRAESA